MATESQPIDIDDESDVVDLCDKSSEDDDDSVVDLTAASPASPKRRRSVIDIEDEAVARQLELEEQRAAKRRKKAEERDARCSCLLYTSPSPRDGLLSRMPSSA